MARIRLATIASDDTPPAGQVSIYSKTNKKLYLKDDTGAEYELLTAGGISGAYEIDYFDLTAAEELSKEVILNSIPSEPTKTVVDVLSGGGALRYTLDFTIAGNVLSWAGGRFDGILGDGDELRVVYY
jgi:hypothetical protein